MIFFSTNHFLFYYLGNSFEIMKRLTKEKEKVLRHWDKILSRAETLSFYGIAELPYFNFPCSCTVCDSI